MAGRQAPRGLGKITPNPTGTWTLRYWANGKQREETFSTKKLAADRQAKIWHDKRSGEITFSSGGDVRFVDYAESWISGHSNAGTKSWMGTTLRRYVAPVVGTMTLAQVAKDRELAQRLITSSTVSYQRKIRMVLLGPTNEAVKSGRISSHRLAGLKVEEPAVNKDLTPATRAQLKTMSLAMGDKHMVVWLGVLAGLRIGESLGVNIADFIEGGTVLRVQGQRQHNGQVKGNLKSRKGGDYRDVPVSSELWAKAQNAPRDDAGYLFPAKWRGGIYDAYNRARDLAGLPATFVPHRLRDQYATTLLSNLVPITDVSVWLGHQSIQITFKYYSKVIPSAAVRAREVMDRALAG